ncbi:TEL2 family protein [Abortiporus biennis]
MSSEFVDNSLSQIRDVISRLQNPIRDVSSLRSLLAAPLASIKLLPPVYLRYNTTPDILPKGAFNVPKHISTIQKALLEHILPSWGPELVKHNTFGLVEQYFCPDLFNAASSVAGEIALYAYSTILSLPLTEYSVQFLSRLSRVYPIDVLWSTVFSFRNNNSSRHNISWEDCVRNVCAIPGRIANYAGAGKDPSIPKELDQGSYYNYLNIRTENLIHNLSRTKRSREGITSVIYLLNKLVNVGNFPPSIPTSPAQPSFFKSTLPIIRSRLSSSPSYTAIWPEIIGSIESIFTLQAILTSFFAQLDSVENLSILPHDRSKVRKEAILLRGVLGRLNTENSELWDALSAVCLGRQWTTGHARIFTCWVAGADKDSLDIKALEKMLKIVVDMWTTPDHIRHSLLGKHHYLTSLLLITLSYLTIPTKSPTVKSTAVNDLALSPPFISSISTFISHLDPSIRRCGMLVAEEVASGAGKNLDFGDWDGENDGKAWCRRIRELIQGRDVDADIEVDVDSDDEHEELLTEETIPSIAFTENPKKSTLTEISAGDDSDDSLTGYISSPSSSRSPSPTPSELEEYEKDPTLRVGRKKISRPVYLAQLGEMIRPTSGLRSDQEEGEAEKIQIALDVAEELIRRKRSYGTELEENAINLTYGLIGLNDNYKLDGFDSKRQNALNALVACCPRKAAPCIIEEFFKNQYSTDQRYVMMNALALGARELASLPVPTTTALQPSSNQRISFPSKRLPPALHNRYLTTGDEVIQPVQKLLEDISREAIDKSKEATTDKVPQYVRERQLRIRKPTKITEIPSSSTMIKIQSTQMMQNPMTSFTDVAAEYFICPLVNRFWLFLRDEQSREEITAHQSELHRYRSAGTGLILSALVLSQMLATLTVLIHASRNAKEWLAIIAPDTLELAVTLGTRPLSKAEGENEDQDSDDDEIRISGSSPKTNRLNKGKGGKEAAVLTNALELAVVILDESLDLDGGRSLSLEHTALVVGAGEWAGQILTQLEKGVRVLGGGGIQEARLRRAAAGVIIKVDEVTSKWRRSMMSYEE